MSIPFHISRRTIGGSALAAGVLLAFGASSALAHVGTDKSEITAGQSTTLTFSIGHGCEDSPTNSMAFQVPESVLNAAPQVKAGWTITTESEELAEPVVAGHGEEQTDRVALITFTADDGNAVDPHYRDSFTLAFKAPAEEGELFFKVIQGCETGENAWISEWDGTGTEPDSPAPSVMVVAGADGAGSDHHAEETANSSADHAEETTATGVTVGSDSDDDGDSSSNGLAVTGIVVGGLGLVAGGTALARGRRGG